MPKRVDSRRMGSDWLVKYEADRLGRQIRELREKKRILLLRLRTRRYRRKKRGEPLFDKPTIEVFPL